MLLGITGKSGTGKHTAGKFLEQKGWKVLYADQVAHKLYRPYQRVWREVVDRFGEGILTTNDVIDRQKLKKIVFNPSEESQKALKELNAIVHPEVKRYLKDEAYYLSKRKAKAAIVAALWEEMGLLSICDKVLLLQAGEALCYDRIHKRDGVDIEMFQTYSSTQKDPPNPDFTITNEGQVNDLYKELNKLLSEL
ncbi:MAG: dephospho-CoA kinase [Candidatus Peregrinibacteria bacterium]|nr:dephospho-CoA kinase [Candidatus Peregrinibacteria bacterium]